LIDLYRVLRHPYTIYIHILMILSMCILKIMSGSNVQNRKHNSDFCIVENTINNHVDVQPLLYFYQSQIEEFFELAANPGQRYR